MTHNGLAANHFRRIFVQFSPRILTVACGLLRAMLSSDVLAVRIVDVFSVRIINQSHLNLFSNRSIAQSRITIISHDARLLKLCFLDINLIMIKYQVEIVLKFLCWFYDLTNEILEYFDPSYCL